MNSLLQLKDVHACYGAATILRGLSFNIHAGEVVALLGRNGTGRSTCLKSIMGMVNVDGDIRFHGTSISGWPSYRIAQAGIAYVPESRDIFPGLTVEQNLLLGVQTRESTAAKAKMRWSMEDGYDLFPILRERRHQTAGTLSGGEQQMLSLIRSLLGNPDLLLVDEPTEGLAPQVIKQLLDFFLELKDRGLTILMVEQKLDLAMQLADRFVLLGHGQAIFDGSREDFIRDTELRREWLQL